MYSQTTRRDFVKMMGLAAVAAPSLMGGKWASGAGGRKLKNVIFILSDDHRYDFMSFLNTPEFLQTPNMDRMAQQGAYLKYATVSTALCSPSRASVLTGQYAHKHGVVDNNSRVPEGTRFFPEALQKAGYQTAFMGKWHMGGSTDAPRPGFDKWISFRGQGVYHDPVLNIDGEKVTRKGHISDILTEYALDWLQNQRDPDKPYFLYLSHKAVHAMFEPAQRHLNKYEDVKLKYPDTMANTEANYKDKPDWVKAQRNSWHGVDYMYHGQMDFDTFYKRYCETLLGVDESIGKVLDYVDAKASGSTLVMYMGDNGFSFGEHGLIDKRQMYESSMRVPMLAYAPGVIRPGTVIEEMVQNIDVGPTVLEVARLKVPERMDGQSFLKLLAGKKISWRDEAYYEYYWERNFPQTPTTHGVRTKRYKYMHYHGIWDKDELYDLQADPDEKHNLIDDPKHKVLVKQMNTKLFDWLERTDGMLIPLRRDSGGQMNKRRPVAP
jgi:N-acetylglucosamine-6-sulfatase